MRAWRTIDCEATVNGATIMQGGDVVNLTEASGRRRDAGAAVLVAVAFVLTTVAAVMAGRSSSGRQREDSQT